MKRCVLVVNWELVKIFLGEIINALGKEEYSGSRFYDYGPVPRNIISCVIDVGGRQRSGGPHRSCPNADLLSFEAVTSLQTQLQCFALTTLDKLLYLKGKPALLPFAKEVCKILNLSENGVGQISYPRQTKKTFAGSIETF